MKLLKKKKYIYMCTYTQRHTHTQIQQRIKNPKESSDVCPGVYDLSGLRGRLLEEDMFEPRSKSHNSVKRRNGEQWVSLSRRTKETSVGIKQNNAEKILSTMFVNNKHPTSNCDSWWLCCLLLIYPPLKEVAIERRAVQRFVAGHYVGLQRHSKRTGS